MAAADWRAHDTCSPLIDRWHLNVTNLLLLT